MGMKPKVFCNVRGIRQLPEVWKYLRRVRRYLSQSKVAPRIASLFVLGREEDLCQGFLFIWRKEL